MVIGQNLGNRFFRRKNEPFFAVCEKKRIFARCNENRCFLTFCYKKLKNIKLIIKNILINYEKNIVFRLFDAFCVGRR